MNTIKVNGITITTGRGNIVVERNKVFIDGVDVTPDSKEIKIEVTGNVDTIKADCCSQISVSENVHSVQTASGDIKIGGDVNGSVTTMSGDVECGNVMQYVTTVSGDVDCDNVSGNVKTVSGDINRR